MAHRTFAHSHNRQYITPTRILLFSLISLCLVLGMLALYRFFRVVHVLCSEELQTCDQKVMADITTLKGKSMFSVQSPVIAGKNVEIDKKYPQTVFVHIKNQQIVTSIFLDQEHSQGTYLFADSTLSQVVSREQISSGATTFTDLRLFASDAKLTRLSQERFDVYTDLLAFSKTTKIIEIIIRSDEEIEIVTESALRAILSSSKVVSQLRSLQLLLASPTIEKKPARVDMRFDQPVLLYDY